MNPAQLAGVDGSAVAPMDAAAAAFHTGPEHTLAAAPSVKSEGSGSAPAAGKMGKIKPACDRCKKMKRRCSGETVRGATLAAQALPPASPAWP
jgi:hypothetical protein